MLAMNKILVPVDFSEAGAGAVHHAAALARHFHSEMLLVHVQTPVHYTAGGMDGAYLGPAPEVLAEQERKELELFLAEEIEDLPVRRVLLEGDAARRIVQFAEAEKVDLIVMPTHGYGFFRRFILGSVTAKVLHDVACPVWTGMHLKDAPAADPLHIRSVLCAVDLSPHSRRTLCWAAQAAAEFGARLTVVHATASLDMSGLGGRYFAPEWRDVLITHAKDGIAKLQQDLGTQAEVFIESGAVPEVVRMAAEEASADLLVIGRSPAGGRLRTNAYALIRESPCPVASV